MLTPQKVVFDLNGVIRVKHVQLQGRERLSAVECSFLSREVEVMPLPVIHLALLQHPLTVANNGVEDLLTTKHLSLEQLWRRHKPRMVT